MARFSCATWRPISTNTGGTLGPNLGLILHHAVAEGSLFGFFNSPSAQVSAHFWVSQSGLIEQYVDTGTVAWHAMQMNGRYVGVETEGCSAPPHAEPMSEAMLWALGRLYAEGMERHGWPAQLAEADGQAGFGFHRMGVNTACPCAERLRMRPEILRRATGTSALPPEEDDEMDARIATNPNNRGQVLLDLATGEYKGFSSPDMLNYFKAQGVKEATGLTPAQWDNLKQVGTL
jgi:hypothetical protein